MQTTFYFVRHGQVHNPQQVLYGRLPRFGLTKQGEKQIEQTANFLATKEVDHLYASPLLRARKTALIIHQKLHIPIYYSKHILETYTSAQGISLEAARKINFDTYPAIHNKFSGESLKDIAKRMMTFIKQTTKKHPGEKIVAVSHGDPIMSLGIVYHNLPFVLESLREHTSEYIRHGEVFEVMYDMKTDTITSLKSIFKPHLQTEII